MNRNLSHGEGANREPERIGSSGEKKKRAETKKKKARKWFGLRTYMQPGWRVTWESRRKDEGARARAVREESNLSSISQVAFPGRSP